MNITISYKTNGILDLYYKQTGDLFPFNLYYKNRKIWGKRLRLCVLIVFIYSFVCLIGPDFTKG